MRTRGFASTRKPALLGLLPFITIVACGDSTNTSSTSDTSSDGGGPSSSSTGDGGNTTTSSSGTGGSINATTTSSTGGGGSTTGSGGQGGDPSTTTTTSSSGGGGSAATTTSSAGGGGSTSSAGGAGGAAGCDSDQKLCGVDCVFKNDADYGCDDATCAPCDVSNAVPMCMSKACTIDFCNLGYDDCNVVNSDGCEIDTDTDPANCGMCDNICNLPNATSTCSAGECAVDMCTMDTGNCDGNATNGCETDTLTDGAHCGTCNNVCGPNATCMSGSCMQAFGCSFNANSRVTAFDAFKIDGTEPWALLGGIGVISAADVHVSTATFSKGVVAHWNGADWQQLDLPGAEEVHEVGAAATNDVYVAARGNSGTQAMLFHWDDVSYTLVANQPTAKSFESVKVVDANNVFLTGWKTSGYRVWRKSGSSWVDMNAPTPWVYGRYYRVSALDANNVFVTGEVQDAMGNAIQGVLLYWNGTSWTNLPVPVGVVQLFEVDGRSLSDLYVTGMNNASAGVVYHLTNNLGTWTLAVETANLAGYGPLWSKYPGTFLTSGYQPPGEGGALRITTVDQMAPPDTYSVDGLAYNPVKFAPVPGGNNVYLATNGIYIGSCP